MHSTVESPASSALRSTKRVCGSGPSEASTSSRMPSTIASVRSTSPPKSEWPGVSTMLMRTSRQAIEVFFGAEDAGLAQQRVDQSGFTVVDVGHDGNVADILSSHYWADIKRRDRGGRASLKCSCRRTRCKRALSQDL